MKELKDMTNAKRFVSVMVLDDVGRLHGSACTSNTNSGYAEETVLSPVPERLSFVAPTFDRDVDNGATHDLRNSFDGPVLMLWVAAGCSGCHDWTAMLSEELEAGNISNTTNIVSVHRYPAFESINDVEERYTNNNTSTHTPWPLLPPESTKVIDAETGRLTDVASTERSRCPSRPPCKSSTRRSARVDLQDILVQRHRFGGSLEHHGDGWPVTWLPSSTSCFGFPASTSSRSG